MPKSFGKMLPFIIAYIVIVLGIFGIILLLVDEVTTNILLSMLFIFIPLTAIFGSVCYSLGDKRDNTMQNTAFTTVSILYFIAAVVLTVILNVLGVSLRVFAAFEIVLMIISVVLALLLYSAKSHIESDD